MRLGFLIPLGFAIGAALSAFMLRNAPQSIHTDLAQPLVVVTYWRHFGALMWLSLAIAAAIASIGYTHTLCHPEVSKGGRGIEALSKGGRGIEALSKGGLASTSSAVLRYLSVTMALSALACAAALTFPVVFSSDVYAYAGYGDMALHGISPYVHAHVAARDPLLDAMVWQWGNPPPMCVYGPVFVWIAKAIVAAFLPLGAAAPLWALRILACIALVACAPLAYAAFAKYPRATRLSAAAAIALNPIAIWSAAEGHNDTLALAIVLAGFALLARGARFAGPLVVALSALVKAPGALAAVALCAVSWSDRSRFARVASGTALGIGLVLALAVPLEYGVRTHLLPAGHYLPQYSLQDVSLPLALVAIAALVWSSRFNLLAISLAAFLAIPNPYPWYAVWLLPIAFLAWESSGAWALIGCSLLIILRYYPDATSALPAYGHAAIVTLQFGIPMLLMAWHIWNARPGRRGIRTPVPGFAPRHSA